MLYQLAGTSTRIMGTMHMVPVGQEGWRKPVAEALDWASRVFVESRQDGLAEKLLAAESPLRASSLPENLLKGVKTIWHSPAAPIDDWTLPRLWFVAQGLNMKWADGVEAFSESLCHPEELESVQDLVSAFDSTPVSDFATLIRKRVLNTAQAQNAFERFYSAWRRFDVKAMRSIAFLDTTPAIKKALFDVRNIAWAPKIAEACKASDTTLILCGAGHLLGTGSLLQVLSEQHGITSLPIR